MPRKSNMTGPKIPRTILEKQISTDAYFRVGPTLRTAVIRSLMSCTELYIRIIVVCPLNFQTGNPYMNKSVVLEQ